MTSPESEQHFAAEEWSAFVDGEIAPAPYREMRAHLLKCPRCAAIARSFETVQQDSKELVRLADLPPARLRQRMLDSAAVMLNPRRLRKRWIWIFGISLVVGISLAWIGFKRNEVFVQPEAVVEPVHVSLNRVLLTRTFLDPVSLDYEITIHHQRESAIVVHKVVVRDPLGEHQQILKTPLRIAPGRGVEWVFGRIVNHRLPAGRYRIWLLTERGVLSAEKVLTESKDP